MSRIRRSAGTLPSPQLDRLATSHPFIHQIDVVFPSHAAQDHDPFTSLHTAHATAQFTLSELYAYANANAHAAFKALPIGDAEDTWCIDPRGLLTLSVSKTRYETLGLVGRRVPFKGCPERYVIDVPLQRATSVGMQARQRTALDIWDRAREAEGLGRWCVAYVGAGNESKPETHAAVEVAPRVRRATNVHVPHVGDLTGDQDADAEAHHARLEALFEWVGMACLGAQRLHASDRVDPYVAVYEPPSPASIGDVSHIRWQGMMDGTFVRSVIDTALSLVSQSSGDNHAFISVTLHSNPSTPVSYIPEPLTKAAPMRVPGLEAEDTICLILSKSSDRLTWGMGQSIGRWDTRWG